MLVVDKFLLFNFSITIQNCIAVYIDDDYIVVKYINIQRREDDCFMLTVKVSKTIDYR